MECVGMKMFPACAFLCISCSCCFQVVLQFCSSDCSFPVFLIISLRARRTFHLNIMWNTESFILLWIFCYCSVAAAIQEFLFDFYKRCLRSSQSAHSQRRDKPAFSKAMNLSLYESETPGEMQPGFIVLQMTLYGSLKAEKSETSTLLRVITPNDIRK